MNASTFKNKSSKTLLAVLAVMALVVTTDSQAATKQCLRAKAKVSKLSCNAVSTKSKSKKLACKKQKLVAKKTCAKKKEDKKEEQKVRMCAQVVVCAEPPMPKCEKGKVCIQVMPQPMWFSTPCAAADAGARIVDNSVCENAGVAFEE